MTLLTPIVYAAGEIYKTGLRYDRYAIISDRLSSTEKVKEWK
jgi:hypothetical protein